MIDFLILIAVGLVGLVAHWFKKWVRGETGNFHAYMTIYKKSSISSVLSLFAAIVGMYSIGDVEITKQVLATTFLVGYTIDSTINKAPEVD